MATHDRCGLPITVDPFCDHFEDTGYDSGLLPAVCGALELYPPGQVRWVAESAGGAFALSANSTVTCLYSAVSPDTAVGAPHSSQNLAFSRRRVPHEPHATPAVIRAPPI